MTSDLEAGLRKLRGLIDKNAAVSDVEGQQNRREVTAVCDAAEAHLAHQSSLAEARASVALDGETRVCAPLFATPAEAAACLREYIRVGSMRSTTEDRELNARAALESLEAEVGRLNNLVFVQENSAKHMAPQYEQAKARISALESELAEKTARVAELESVLGPLDALPALPSEPVKP